MEWVKLESMADSSPRALQQAAKGVQAWGARLLNPLSLPGVAVLEQQPQEGGRTSPRGWSWLRAGAAGWKIHIYAGYGFAAAPRGRAASAGLGPRWV